MTTSALTPCPTCGTPCRVPDGTTKRYEPVAAERIAELEAMIRDMAPVIKAAVEWSELPRLEIGEELTEEEAIAQLAAEMAMVLALSGGWEEYSDGKWRKKPQNEG